MSFLDEDIFTTPGYDEAFSRARMETPVYYDEKHDRWMLFRYDDIAKAYSDKRFSSRFGTIVGGSINDSGDSASNRMLICSDAPHHARLRKSHMPLFDNSSIAIAETSTRRMISAAGDSFLNGNSTDYLHAVLHKLPLAFFSQAYGIDIDSSERLLELSEKLIGYADPLVGDPAAPASQRAVVHLELLTKVIDSFPNRTELPPKFFSTSNAASLTDEEYWFNFLNIFVGGSDTTPYTAAAMTEFLMASDAAAHRQLYVSNRAGYLSEVFRWTSTNAYVQRRLLADVEIDGTYIPAGSYVVLWNYSANFDETYFSATFAPGEESPVPHLAFGRGAHRCIGAQVSSMEIAVYLDWYFDKMGSLGSGATFTPLRSAFMRGYSSVRLELK